MKYLLIYFAYGCSKFLFILINCLLTCTFLSAQVSMGINTVSPQSLFHIDGMGNTIGASNVSDDLVVSSTGNMGIGTISPDNKLVIANPVSYTGLRLPEGVGLGRGLIADTDGNVVWLQVYRSQTAVYTDPSGAQSMTGMIVGAVLFDPNTWVYTKKLTGFDGVIVDNVDSVFGVSGYGWNKSGQYYKVPVDGSYKITLSVYFLSWDGNAIPKINNRAYIFKKKANATDYEVFLEPGLISVTDVGADVKGIVSSVVHLKKDDELEVRLNISNGPAGLSTINYWAAIGHTYLCIESI